MNGKQPIITKLNVKLLSNEEISLVYKEQQRRQNIETAKLLQEEDERDKIRVSEIRDKVFSESDYRDLARYAKEKGINNNLRKKFLFTSYELKKIAKDVFIHDKLPTYILIGKSLKLLQK